MKDLSPVGRHEADSVSAFTTAHGVIGRSRYVRHQQITSSARMTQEVPRATKETGQLAGNIQVLHTNRGNKTSHGSSVG